MGYAIVTRFAIAKVPTASQMLQRYYTRPAGRAVGGVCCVRLSRYSCLCRSVLLEEASTGRRTSTPPANTARGGDPGAGATRVWSILRFKMTTAGVRHDANKSSLRQTEQYRAVSLSVENLRPRLYRSFRACASAA